MTEYGELVQALTWLLTNRVQQKIEYTRGLLGDGNGRVRVSATPNSPDVDYVYVRPDRFSDRTYKVFNKRIEGQDGDPVIIGELPWEPDLIQVVDMDWAAYADVGWGDDITTTNRHGISHQWRDGAPGIDTFNVYRRQMGDLKTYAATSGTLSIGVSPYSLDIYGTQYQWPGTQSFPLTGALPTTTGTARMALVYWSPASGTTGYLGVASGTLGSSADATILNRPVTPEGAIPSAFVRLKGGQTSVTEFDIFDAREPFRPGILFGTGSAAALNASLIPILDNSGLYTGSTVESALDQIGFDGARISKVYESDFGAVALQSDASGNITINGTGTFTIPSDIIHGGDTDTKIGFTTDLFEATVGNKVMLRLTNTTQDIVEIGDVSGGGDVDVSINNGVIFLQGSNGYVGIGEVTAPETVLHVKTSASSVPYRVEGTGVFVGMQFKSNTASPNAFFDFTDSTDAILTRFNHVGGNMSIQVRDTGGDLDFRTDDGSGLTVKVLLKDTGLVSFGDPAPTTPLGQVHVDQASATAAIPVLYLDQADVSEEMIQFETTIGTGNAIEAVGAKTLTTTHFIKVTLPGALTRYIPAGTIA